MGCAAWRRDARELDAPQSSVTTDVQADFHWERAALRSMVRVASWIVGEMAKAGQVWGAVTVTGTRQDGGRLQAVALRVANRLCTSSRT